MNLSLNPRTCSILIPTDFIDPFFEYPHRASFEINAFSYPQTTRHANDYRNSSRCSVGDLDLSLGIIIWFLSRRFLGLGFGGLDGMLGSLAGAVYLFNYNAGVLMDHINRVR